MVASFSAQQDGTLDRKGLSGQGRGRNNTCSFFFKRRCERKKRSQLDENDLQCKSGELNIGCTLEFHSIFKRRTNNEPFSLAPGNVFAGYSLNDIVLSVYKSLREDMREVIKR